MPKHLIVNGKPVKVTADEALKLAEKGAKYISKNEYKRMAARAAEAKQ